MSCTLSSSSTVAHSLSTEQHHHLLMEEAVKNGVKEEIVPVKRKMENKSHEPNEFVMKKLKLNKQPHLHKCNASSDEKRCQLNLPMNDKLPSTKDDMRYYRWLNPFCGLFYSNCRNLERITNGGVSTDTSESRYMYMLYNSLVIVESGNIFI